MSYVVGSKVKEYNKKHGCNTAGDLIDALNKMVEWKLEQGCMRAEANGRKTVRANDVCMGKPGKMPLVVGSKVKEYNKKKGCNTAGDLMDSLNASVEWMLEMACKRAMANGRKTVRGTDV